MTHQWEFDLIFGAMVRRTWSPSEAEAILATEVSWMESIEDEMAMIEELDSGQEDWNGNA